VTLAEELGDAAGLGVEVARSDLGPVLHLLDGGGAGLAAVLLLALRRLVLPLAVVEDLADRRVGLRRDLDEIEIVLSCQLERLREGLDPELVPLGIDEPDLSGPDALVDPRFVGSGSRYVASLLGSR
jgi:hypothetical protein